MQSDCDVTVDAGEFARAIRQMRTRQLSRLRMVRLEPAEDGLKVRLVGKTFEAATTLTAAGRWTRRVAVQGAVVARVASRFGSEPLNIVYVSGRVYFNTFSVDGAEA